MKQTNATFLIDDGVLMADKDQVVSIANARVIVEPRDEPSAHDAEKRTEEMFQRMDKAGTRLMRYLILLFVLYMASEIIHAFTVGAVPGIGK